jgi:protein-S-isoprenylcysteine O-methyltransferase Ste14
MEILRVILLLGLVFHKVLWEMLRRRDGGYGKRRRMAKDRGKSLVKSIKAVVLAFLIIQTAFLDILPISSRPTIVKMLGVCIYFLGLGTAVVGRIQLGKNWADLEDYQVLQGQSLVSSGIYRYIRHPIYAGDILLLLGLELALNSWLVLAVLAPLLVAVRQALVEEAVLLRAFPDYADYCARTKRFIPFVV